MYKKQVKKAQFNEVHTVEKEMDGMKATRVVTQQKAIEWEILLEVIPDRRQSWQNLLNRLGSQLTIA